MPPTYAVYTFCPVCSVPHNALITLTSQTDIGGDAERLGDMADGVRLPINQLKLRNVGGRCPTSGETVTARDNDDVFLVRVANDP